MANPTPGRPEYKEVFPNLTRTERRRLCLCWRISRIYLRAHAQVSGSAKDPWEALFDAGKHDRPEGSFDLIPFWVYSVEGGAKIERHVPALPLSRDLERFDGLRRSLAVYRMVFGQTRQEDLLAFLLARVPQEDVDRVMRELRIDLAPPPYQTADIRTSD